MGVLAEVSGDSWKAGWDVQESSAGLLATVDRTLNNPKRHQHFLLTALLGMHLPVRFRFFDRCKSSGNSANPDWP